MSIGEVCKVVSGATPRSSNQDYWDGDVPFVTPKDLSDLGQKYISEPSRKITSAGFRSCSTTMLPPNSVLLSSRAPIGLVAINTVPVCTNQGFKSLVPRNGKIAPDYLYWWLKSHTEALQQFGRGATFKEVSKGIVEGISIPLPPLPEQKRIATILDAADALRTKRRESLEQLDELVQSVFLDMFGDPVSNPQGWEKCSIGKVGTVTTGNTPSRKEPDNYGDGIEWIKSDNIGTDDPVLSEATERLSEKGEAKARIVEAGSVLVACIAGSRSSIGRAAIADRRVAFNQQINAFTAGETVDPWYFLGLLRCAQHLIQDVSTNSMKGMVSKSRFMAVEIPIPPYAEQLKFRDRVLQIFQLRRAAQAHLAELDTLFASLQSRAFRGEL